MQTAFPFWGPFMGDGLDVGLSPDEMRALSLHAGIEYDFALALGAGKDQLLAVGSFIRRDVWGRRGKTRRPAQQHASGYR